MIYCGIDIGKKGAIAFIDTNVNKQWAYKMPIIGKDLNIAEIKNIFTAEKPDLIVIEKQQSFPKQGVASTFRLGFQFGALLGLAIGMGIPVETVSPLTWKKKVLVGTAKDKAAAIMFVQRRYPSLVFNGKKLTDGIADAVCIAEYGRLRG